MKKYIFCNFHISMKDIKRQMYNITYVVCKSTISHTLKLTVIHLSNLNVNNWFPIFTNTLAYTV